MMVLHNETAEFATEALAGFVLAEAFRVTAVHGGVVRSVESPRGQVSIVMGGGSGHFPAFAGWVGPGFGHAAVCGNIFASPSELQVLSVARAADNGGGMLFMPINYAGDILHFSAAAEKLRSEGADVRMVPITDDIASGPADKAVNRRGVAGSFIVLKIVGAAAENGWSLDEVDRIARSANEATRTFGVAFSGCTLPGSPAPLFTLPEGRMALGLGIHGEPGISETERGNADEVADVLVDGLFGERRPKKGQRVAVLVNGLGGTSYDELAIVFRRVTVRMEEEEMVLLAPVVGQQVTSIDMAGLSVSFTYLDDELSSLWLAAADTASFHREGAPRRTHRVIRKSLSEDDDKPIEANEESRALAVLVVGALRAVVSAVSKEEQRLGELDAIAGDGDHGSGMLRGAKAALNAASQWIERGAGVGTVLGRAGAAWSDVGGGTSGALWGTGLVAAGSVLDDWGAADARAVSKAVSAFVDALARRGGAELGDKTMLDAAQPFAETFEAAVAGGSGAVAAWRTASARARSAAEGTAKLFARRGRSRIHGGRTLGSPDPGAVSFAIVVAAALEDA